MGILTKIRQRPDQQKRVIALVSAAVLTLVVVVVWFSFTARLSRDEADLNAENKLSSLSPMQVIKDVFTGIFSDFKDQTSTMATSTEQATSSNNLSSSTVEVIEATSTGSTNSPQAATSTNN